MQPNNVIDPNEELMTRDPATVLPEQNPQGLIRDLLLGKQGVEVPYLPKLTQAAGQVTPAQVSRLTDIATSQQTMAELPPPPQVSSTAPKQITEKELAGRVRGTSDTLDRNLEGAPSFYEAASAGIESKMNAEESKNVTEALFLEERKKQIQDELDALNAREAEARAKAEQQIASIGSIDPNRVWNDRSIWSKMALVLGSARGARAGSMAGLQMMQVLVAKDIEAQRADMDAGIKRGGSLLEMLKPYASNRNELLKMANQVGMKLAEKYSDAIKAKIGRGAAPMMAIEKTMKEYTQPLLAEKNKADANLVRVSGQEQNRREADQKLFLDRFKALTDQSRLKFDKGNMSESDAKRLEGTTAMAIAANKMEELENDRNFDPTAIKNGIASYMQGKGIPSSLNKDQAEYLANYLNYFVYEKQAITGAAATDKETEIIKLLTAPDTSFTKDAIKIYQKRRANNVNARINAMNPPALLRVGNIPELSRYNINRGKVANPK